MSKQTYRICILLLTALLFLVIAWGVSFYQDNDEELILPDALENIYPLPNDQVPQQASLEIDLPVAYRLVLIVDNYIIPESEIQYVDATGLYIWKPGPNKTFETWKPGKHYVRITWDTVTGLPDYGEYSWEFSTY
ncbi:MAG: hypothetical protein CL496_00725 [Actinobacteria bacterium]|jgi:hypothetical protein|nr:hypothetical protein [Actinomycetota bacterium]|tara:strand:+ start:2970 stop:3374 length:405 start_codon:yes stop_codon:yes gene_type:complete